MNSDDAASQPSSATPSEGGNVGKGVSNGARMNPMPPTAKLVAWALAAGILAGIVSWLIGELVLETFRPPLQKHTVMGRTLMKASFADQSAADSRNAALAFAVLGGLMAAALGFAGGLASQSIAAGTKAAALGVVIGSLMGAGFSFGLLPVYFHALEVNEEELSRDLILPLLVHCGIWAACGLAGGVAFGLGLRAGVVQIARSGIGGLIGAAMGASIYELVGALVFTNELTTSPLSLTWSTRLLARLLVTTLAAVMAAVFVSAASRHSGGSTPTT